MNGRVRDEPRVERLRRTVAELEAALADRERLIRHVLEIQRAISRRAPLQEVLDALTAGASAQFGDEIVGLRVLDPNDPGYMLLVSSCGLPADTARAIRHASVHEGIGGWAIREGRLVTIDRYAGDPESMADLAGEGISAAMAAPVGENGAVIGSLIVGSRVPGRRFSAAEQEGLLVFAEHASLALSNAHTLTALDQAFHDSLTGLPNRALFLDRLEHASAVANRELARMGLLFVDLDGFKTVNDSLGHAAGDELLSAVAARLRSSVRAADTPARLGGDEFAVLVEGVTRTDDAIDAAQRILDGLREPFDLRGQLMTVSASIGIALSDPGQAVPGELLRSADLAMYRAKSQGRGRHAVYETAMHAEVLERLEVEADLRRAVEADEFVVHYQPVVRLDTSQIVGFEALVRWAHPQRGLIAPAGFITIAEDLGLIGRLGRTVLRTACEQARGWQPRSGSTAPVEISVNLSVWELRQPDLVAQVAEVLASTGCPPEALVLEITETMLMHDPPASAQRMRELSALGVRLAIDDFGTGYSSLSYLRDYPFDVLKLDRAFVEHIGRGQSADEKPEALVRTIIALGDDLSLTTLAEGIERREQLSQLRALGCRLGQGYLFSRPVPAEQATALLPWT